MDYLTDRRKVMTSRPSQHTPHTIHPLKPTAMVFTCRQTDLQARHYYTVDELYYFVFITVVMSFFLVLSCSLSLAEVPNKLYLASAAHVTPFIIMVVAVCKLSLESCNHLKESLMYTENSHIALHDLLSEPCSHYETLRETRIVTCVKGFSLKKITSKLRKQLYIYVRLKKLITKMYILITLSIYMMSVHVWKNVTRPLNCWPTCGVKKVSVIARKTFGIGCQAKIDTHISPRHHNVSYGNVYSKIKLLTIRIFQNVACRKVKNLHPVLHLGFSVMLVYAADSYRLYDRFLTLHTGHAKLNVRDVSSRTVTIEHTKSLITEKEPQSKEKWKFWNKSIKYTKPHCLSYEIHSKHYYKNENISDRAEKMENTGNIRFKMECDSMMSTCMQRHCVEIMIMFHPYTNTSMEYDTKLYFFEND